MMAYSARAKGQTPTGSSSCVNAFKTQWTSDIFLMTRSQLQTPIETHVMNSNGVSGRRPMAYHVVKTTTPLAITVLLFALQPASRGQTEPSNSGACQPIQVPMCQGLVNYNSTKLPNEFGHVNQNQVYWALQPWWPFLDAGCSDNLRNYLCGLYLPKCAGATVEPYYPCTETCKKAKARCKKLMKMQSFKWSKDFKCGKLLTKDSHRCIKPVREGKKKQRKEHALCQKNTLPMCQGLPFSLGSLPNTYLQGDSTEISKEMRHYQPLVDSRCSSKLAMFLCGAYMPFCLDAPTPAVVTTEVSELKELGNKIPFVVPCRELCQEVYSDCRHEYHRLTGGLPWPGKLQCHRFPSAVSFNYRNISNPNASVHGDKMSCTMPPN